MRKYRYAILCGILGVLLIAIVVGVVYIQIVGH